MLFKLILWIIIFYLLYSLIKKTFAQFLGQKDEEETSNVKGRKKNEDKLYNPDDVVDVKYEELPDDELKNEKEKDD